MCIREDLFITSEQIACVHTPREFVREGREQELAGGVPPHRVVHAAVSLGARLAERLLRWVPRAERLNVVSTVLLGADHHHTVKTSKPVRDVPGLLVDH